LKPLQLYCLPSYRLLCDFFETDTLVGTRSKDIPGVGRITAELPPPGTIYASAFTALLIELAVGTTAQVLGNWLWSSIHNSKSKTPMIYIKEFNQANRFDESTKIGISGMTQDEFIRKLGEIMAQPEEPKKPEQRP
jgi:hypothetical protein